MHIEPLEHRQLFAAGPSAALKVSPKSPTLSTSTVQLIVTYTDANGIDPASIGDRDLRLTGPRDYVHYARAVTSTVNGDGTQRIITYKVGAPNGSNWTSKEDGTYTVKLRGAPDGVSDIAGNFAKAQTLGTFIVQISGPGAAAPAAFHGFSNTPITAAATAGEPATDVLSDLKSL
jgi:hypothetical protein